MKYKTLEDIEAAKLLISHPGETLIDTIEAKDISQAELASRMGRPVKTINEIIQGKTAITPETAIQLERVLGISAEFWIEREQNYRLELAEIAETEKLLEKSQWLKNFPLVSMKTLGWIDFSKNEIIEQFNAVLSFFSVSNVGAYHSHYEIEETVVAYRMINTGDKNPHNVNAWLRQGEIQAHKLPTIDFDATKFKTALDSIKTIMANHPDNFFEQLQTICLQAGVKVVHTPCLPKTKLHGSTRWINNTALIQLSNQYQRNDIFWFTFFHEAGHILKHGKKDVFVEGLDYTAEGLKKEVEANEFASKYTFSAKEEKILMAEIVKQADQVAYIYDYAKKINTHPAQIIGHLARKNILHPSVGWTHNFYKKVDLSQN
ncbi:HTH-type transcriptional regulator/antitoxin HigA [Flavobacterium sp. PL11]|uniref:HigA family addiction module antitoxin n=1 Tax=Flavobacterium sp. PL11 TaxID=3071717 RepID=UPI002E0A5967|nr:HTH-type transcriptional regulator/antitoxin HigA [Flavobacterium sp. PL11]